MRDEAPFEELIVPGPAATLCCVSQVISVVIHLPCCDEQAKGFSLETGFRPALYKAQDDQTDAYRACYISWKPGRPRTVHASVQS